MTLAEILDKRERGRIGHGEAVHWLVVDSCNELAEIVHYNGPTDAGAPPDAARAGNPILAPANHAAAAANPKP
jgi:hypothetical protein